MTQHRTQLYLDDRRYRWLKARAERHGSIAGVVRDLIDDAMASQPPAGSDPLIRYLLEEAPGEGATASSVRTLDDDLYGL